MTRDPTTGTCPPSAAKDAAPIGELELATYKRLWRSSSRFRRDFDERLAERQRERSSRTPEPADVAAGKTSIPGGTAPTLIGGFARLRHAARLPSLPGDEDDEAPLSRRPSRATNPIPSHQAAAALLFARMIDRTPAVSATIGTGAPTILIDVADPLMLEAVEQTWQDVLFEGSTAVMDIADGPGRRRAELDACFLVVTEAPKALPKEKAQKRALHALSLALPLVAISPMAKTCLPQALNDAATAHVEFPRLDATTVSRVIRILTGKRLRSPVEATTMARISTSDLIVAVRFDRTPAQCVDELRRLAAARAAAKGAREIALSELHGLGEAREWAEAAIADIKAWKEGRIPWSQVASGIVLTGPAGCGKTTFAFVFCAEAGIRCIGTSLAKWQSNGEAHLGHLLRAMRQDFEAARAETPCCIFIDEIDSFPDRSGVTHSHRDYVVEVVNALLAEIDGIGGREGVVVIGATNDVARCDPALLRGGRLEKIVRIGLPDAEELERMFRVRLKDDLAHEDIGPIVELATGMVGADVERAVKDARRAARRADGRPMTMDDLRLAVAGPDDLTAEERWRTSVHEAAHLLADVVLFGPEEVYATVGRSGRRNGMTIRVGIDAFDGTPDAYRRRLQVLLAGRAGEELLLGEVSHGAGGAPDSDLDKATTLASAMAGSLGLTGPERLTYFGPLRQAGDFLAFAEIRATVARELAEAAGAVRRLVEERLGVLKSVAVLLSSHGRVDGGQVSALLADAAAAEVDGKMPP